MNSYIGHPSQLNGIEEHRLCGGKAEGMRILECFNQKGLRFTVSCDRCGDISRLSYKGINLGFFAPCGYVSPQYYDNKSSGFLKSFTAGFLTTCGLTAVGSACNDNGEELPLHGTISNTPAENVWYCCDNEKLYIRLVIREAALFSHKLVLTREYECPLDGSEITIRDRVKNIGADTAPYLILYHFNMGYPLVSEKAELTLNYRNISPRDERAREGIAEALILEKPQAGFVEQCYYYEMLEGVAEIKNPQCGIRLSINYDTKELPYFTQWKMMGMGEYVLGLEPGNCTPDGRDVMRKKGIMKELKPSMEACQTIKIKISEE